MRPNRSLRKLALECLETRRVLTGIGCGQLAPQSLEPRPLIAAEVAAQPLAAQDAAGNSLDSALALGELAGTREITDAVGRQDRRDFFAFELNGTTDVAIELDQLRSDIDLYLYDAEGKLLGRSVHWGRRAEQLATELDAGTYYVLVSPYRSATSTYRLTLSGTPQAPPVPEDQAGNTRDEARPIGELSGSRAFSDYVGSSDPADYYEFVIAERSQVDLQLSQLEADLDLYVSTASGHVVGSSRRANQADENLRLRLEAGTYYAIVAPYRDAASSYQLDVSGTFVHPAPSQPAPSQPAQPSPAPVQPAPSPTPSQPAPPSQSSPPDTSTAPTIPSRLSNVGYYGGSNEWNLNAIHAPEAWASGYTGEGIVVAVVDTGVDYQHPDLQNSVWVNPGEIAGDGRDNDGNGYVDDLFGWNFADQNADTLDGHGHGTHVAGTIAANRNGLGATGVAYAAQIMPVRVLGDSGSGSSLDVAAGIRYAVDNGADVINLSLGGGNSSAVRSAIQYAAAQGVFVVAASGNDNAAVPTYPAQHSRDLPMLSVGASSSNGQRASFSNRVGNSGAAQVDAPGSNIYSLHRNGRYARMSGTSMATPHVAGLAALLLSANPDLSPAALRQVIVDAADRVIAQSDSLGGISAATAIPLALQQSGVSLASNDPQNSAALTAAISLQSLAQSANQQAQDARLLPLTDRASSGLEFDDHASRERTSTVQAAPTLGPTAADAWFAAMETPREREASRSRDAAEVETLEQQLAADALVTGWRWG